MNDNARATGPVVKEGDGGVAQAQWGIAANERGC